MARLDALFSTSDRESINRAVAEAESLTSAEIIPVVAASSGRYDRSEDVVGLWVGMVALFGVWLIYPAVDDSANSWGSPAPIWQFAAFASAVVAGFLIGAVVAGRVDSLRRLFTPQQQMRDEVSARARAVFFDQRVHHTATSSGVLLYVSLFERMATVLADQTVLDKLGPSQIEALCTEFTRQLHATSPTTAFSEIIRAVGQRLATTLPRSTEKVNELADALVVLD